MEWYNLSNIKAIRYVCGYCDNTVASAKGYFRQDRTGNYIEYVVICPNCDKPTYFDLSHRQVPGSSYGDPVSHIHSKEVESLYNEARECMRVNAYTASVMCCRKLLMNVAVSKGAPENLSFAKYVDFLAGMGFVPPDGKGWVDHIRDKGNEANHEIKLMNEDDAKELISFMEMLLKFIYEFPTRIKKKVDNKSN